MKNTRKLLAVITAFLFSIILPLGAAQAGTNWACFSWNSSSSADVVGYKIYLGTNAGRYFTSVDVGNVNSACITNLTEGIMYFSVATSYSSNALDGVLESDPSNEINFTLGRKPQPPDSYRILNLNHAKTNLISLTVPENVKTVVESYHDADKWSMGIEITGVAENASQLMLVFPQSP